MSNGDNVRQAYEHACPLLERDLRDATGRGRGREWDVSALGPDQLLALWVALGIRVTKRSGGGTQ